MNIYVNTVNVYNSQTEKLSLIKTILESNFQDLSAIDNLIELLRTEQRKYDGNC